MINSKRTVRRTQEGDDETTKIKRIYGRRYTDKLTDRCTDGQIEKMTSTGK